MIGRAKFSSSAIDGKSTSEIREMCLAVGVDCDSYPSEYLRGVCMMRDDTGNWVVHKYIPMFKGLERETIERLINVGE